MAGTLFRLKESCSDPSCGNFRERREALTSELHALYCAALREKGRNVPAEVRPVRITVQGGIGTTSEDTLLREFFGMDGTGWGSPFLLVPEATNVDDETRARLASAGSEQHYISNASPLGIPFNNLLGSASEELIRRRVEEGRPGSPCTKKFLVSNTEFTDDPICTASRQYQARKIKQLQQMDLSVEELDTRIRTVVEKACLCEDLAASPFVGSGERKDASHAVAVCPGPNLAYFTRIATLEEMVGHIYGRLQLVSVPDRPNLFVNELRLYINHLKNEIEKKVESLTANEQRRLTTFRENLKEGIAYYRSLIPILAEEAGRYRRNCVDAPARDGTGAGRAHDPLLRAHPRSRRVPAPKRVVCARLT